MRAVIISFLITLIVFLWITAAIVLNAINPIFGFVFVAFSFFWFLVWVTWD